MEDKQSIRKLFLLVIGMVFLGGLMLPAAKANAAGLTLSQLREKFPHGKYWNHAGSPGSSNAVNNQDGYTSVPCPVHKVVGTNQQTCNGFQPGGSQLSWQCMGYAEKAGYDATGFNPREDANGWRTIRSASALDNLKAGDIVRYKNNGHSIYVTAVNGDTVIYTDCNSDGHCKIRWDQKVENSVLRASFTYVRSAPFEMREDERREDEEDDHREEEQNPAVPRPEIRSVSIDSIDCTGFSMQCTAVHAGLVKVNVESVESGETMSDSFTSGMDALSYQFDADKLQSASGRYRVYIYAYSTPEGGNETLHRVTYGSELGIVTLPPATANPELAYLLDPLVFDTDFYAAYNGDLAKAGITTKLQLVRHWMFCGSIEGRWAAPVFNVRDYVKMNRDIEEAFGTDYRSAIRHFVQYGCRETRKSSRIFWCGYYMEHNPDVAAAAGNNIRAVYEHFVAYGIREGRAGSPLYIPEIYRNNYRDLKAVYERDNYGLMLHWLLYGSTERENRIADRSLTDGDSGVSDAEANTEEPVCSTEEVREDSEEEPVESFTATSILNNVHLIQILGPGSFKPGQNENDENNVEVVTPVEECSEEVSTATEESWEESIEEFTAMTEESQEESYEEDPVMAEEGWQEYFEETSETTGESQGESSEEDPVMAEEGWQEYFEEASTTTEESREEYFEKYPVSTEENWQEYSGKEPVSAEEYWEEYSGKDPISAEESFMEDPASMEIEEWFAQDDTIIEDEEKTDAAVRNSWEDGFGEMTTANPSQTMTTERVTNPVPICASTEDKSTTVSVTTMTTERAANPVPVCVSTEDKLTTVPVTTMTTERAANPVPIRATEEDKATTDSSVTKAVTTERAANPIPIRATEEDKATTDSSVTKAVTTELAAAENASFEKVAVVSPFPETEDEKVQTKEQPDGYPMQCKPKEAEPQVVHPTTESVTKTADQMASSESSRMKQTKRKVVKPGRVKGLRVKAGKNALAVSFRKTARVDGYEIAWATGRRFTGKQKLTTVKAATRYQITGFKTGKRYYVRVRAFRLDLDGKRIYGKYRTVRSGKVK